MSTRVDIRNAVISILENTGKFYKVHKEPTDIEKERSFPVAWVNLSSEMILDGAISTTCYMRQVGLEISLGVKHGTPDTDLGELIDYTFNFIKDEFTLNGTAINVTPVDIVTDRGYFHPYAIASLNFLVTTR